MTQTGQVAFLRLPLVQQRVGLSRSTIYEMVKQGRFPRPVSIGTRAVAWTSFSIDSWVEQRILASHAKNQFSPPGNASS